MNRPSSEERKKANAIARRINPSLSALERAISIFLRCSMSGECLAAYKHVYVIKKLGHRLEALKYYRSQRRKVDVPL